MNNLEDNKNWKKTKVIYYSDEYNDDFAEMKKVKKRPPLKENFPFVSKNPFRRFWNNFFYYGIAKPLLGLFCFFAGIRYKGKENLKGLGKQGAFIYSNHVAITDVFKFQVHIVKCKKINIIGYSDTASIPVVKNIAHWFGYLPLPGDIHNTHNFLKAIKYLVQEKHEYVLIYPEAHIWPYYTKIRHFKIAAFHYPAMNNAPVIPAVTTWQKRWYSKKPKQLVIFGKPIYPQEGKSPAENKEYLATECYNEMVRLSQLYPQYEYIKYIKVEDSEQKN